MNSKSISSQSAWEIKKNQIIHYATVEQKCIMLLQSKETWNIIFRKRISNSIRTCRFAGVRNRSSTSG